MVLRYVTLISSALFHIGMSVFIILILSFSEKNNYNDIDNEEVIAVHRSHTLMNNSE